MASRFGVTYDLEASLIGSKASNDPVIDAIKMNIAETNARKKWLYRQREPIIESYCCIIRT